MFRRLTFVVAMIALAPGCDDGGSAPTVTPVVTGSPAGASSATPSGPARFAAATAIAVAPELLALPNVQTGDDWTIETRVANLDELDIAVGVYPSGMTFVDLGSGRGVAAADFAGNVFVRIRQEPRQLIVSYSSGPAGHRLLIFDVLDRGFALKNELTLPQRYGHQGFTNAMHLSNDGRYAYFGERDFIDRPECDIAGYDGITCLRYSIRVVDLDDPSRYERVQMPERCSPSITPYGARSLAAFCGGSPGTLVVAANGDEPRAVAGYELIPQPSVAGWPDTAFGEYVTVLADGSPRMLYTDGSLRTPDGEFAASVLSPGHTSYGVEKIDDSRVLLSSGERRTNGAPDHMRVFNLASGLVEQAIVAPANMLHATVLDERRGVALAKNGERYAIQIIDFASGTMSAPIELTALGGGPEMIVR